MALAVEQERTALGALGETRLAHERALDFEAIVRDAMRVGVEREVVVRPGDHARAGAGGELCFPRGLRGVEFAFVVLHLFVSRGDLLRQLRQFFLLFRLRHGHARLGIQRARAVLALLRDVMEEGVEAVKLARRDGIVLVVVALGAGEGHAEPRRAQRAHAVHEIDVQVLGINDSALVGGHHVAHETAGHLLLHGRVRQEIAGELLDGEAVERLVVIERFHHPVAPQPRFAERVVVVTRAVRVPREVEPRHREPLTEMRRRQQTVHDVFVGARRFVGEEGIHLGEGRRQAGERERDAAEEDLARGFGLEGELLFFQSRGEEGIDGT